MFVAFIPNSDREVLRIAITRTWVPSMRIPTLRFIDAWATNWKEGKDNIPVMLCEYCENIVVLNTNGITERISRGFYLEEGELYFCRVYAKSGQGREASKRPIGESIDEDVDGDEDEDITSS